MRMGLGGCIPPPTRVSPAGLVLVDLPVDVVVVLEQQERAGQGERPSEDRPKPGDTRLRRESPFRPARPARERVLSCPWEHVFVLYVNLRTESYEHTYASGDDPGISHSRAKSGRDELQRKLRELPADRSTKPAKQGDRRAERTLRGWLLRLPDAHRPAESWADERAFSPWTSS